MHQEVARVVVIMEARQAPVKYVLKLGAMADATAPTVWVRVCNQLN